MGIEYAPNKTNRHTASTSRYPHHEQNFEIAEEVVLPTEEELKFLRRVPQRIPWKVYTIGFVELVERLSFYGTAVLFVNFIESGLTDDLKPTGAPKNPHDEQAQPGALGLGQRTSTALTTFNQFWTYFVPLLGAHIADTYLGRFKTVCHGVAIAFIGHIILTMSAIPGMIKKPDGALTLWIIGIIVMGIGTGFFKPNIVPLIAEQIPNETMYIDTTLTGERVIVDPAITSGRIYTYYYLFINIGALIGHIAMPYTERFVGFYAAYLIPTLLLFTALPVLLVCGKHYTKRKPEGTVLGPAVKLLFLGMKGRFHLNPLATWRHTRDGTFWDHVKPSYLRAATPAWMEFDDAWVDEVARGWAACTVLLYYPLYWLTYNQMNNNLTSQARMMTLHGIPNDVLNALNPIAIMFIIPLMDLVVYPALRQARINFSPIKKITAGFFVSVSAMIWTCIVQIYIYKTSKCGSDPALWHQARKNDCMSPLNVWIQSGSYVLIGFSEVFASVTALEYAFTKAPKNMRSYVQAFFLLMSAISAALSEALTPLSENPLLAWNYAIVAIIAFVGGCLFHLQFRQLDVDEDRLNMLPSGHKLDRMDTESPPDPRLKAKAKQRISGI